MEWIRKWWWLVIFPTWYLYVTKSPISPAPCGLNFFLGFIFSGGGGWSTFCLIIGDGRWLVRMKRALVVQASRFHSQARFAAHWTDSLLSRSLPLQVLFSWPENCLLWASTLSFPPPLTSLHLVYLEAAFFTAAVQATPPLGSLFKSAVLTPILTILQTHWTHLLCRPQSLAWGRILLLPYSEPSLHTRPDTLCPLTCSSAGHSQSQMKHRSVGSELWQPQSWVHVISFKDTREESPFIIWTLTSRRQVDSRLFFLVCQPHSDILKHRGFHIAVEMSSATKISTLFYYECVTFVFPSSCCSIKC